MEGDDLRGKSRGEDPRVGGRRVVVLVHSCIHNLDCDADAQQIRRSSIVVFQGIHIDSQWMQEQFVDGAGVG